MQQYWRKWKVESKNFSIFFWLICKIVKEALKECYTNFDRHSMPNLFMLPQQLKNSSSWAGLQKPPFPEKSEPFQFPYSQEISQLYDESSLYILEPHDTLDNTFKMFNFPIDVRVTDNLAKYQEFLQKHDTMNKAYKL
mgnify:CR=1 FL=1